MAEGGRAGSWGRWAPIGLLLVVAVVLFWPLILHREHLVPFHVLAGDPALTGLDLAADRPDWRFFDESPVVLFYAEKALAAREMRHGELPLWNPDSAIGVPLLANAQSQPFAPFFLPFMARPTPWTYSWVLALQLLFGGLGAALLLRELGCGALARTAAALLFAFNPYALDYLVYSDVWAYVWIPWAFLVAERLARGQGRWGWLALVLAAMAASGHVEVAFFAAVSAFAYLAVRLGQERRGTKAWLRWAGLPLATALLSAWWLIPFAEYVAHSTTVRYAANTCYPYHPSACFIIGAELFWPPALAVLVLVGWTAKEARRPLMALLPGALWSLMMAFPFPVLVQEAATGNLLSGRYGRAMLWFVLVVAASVGVEALWRGTASARWRLGAAAGALAWLALGLVLRQPTLAEAASKNWVPLRGAALGSSLALVLLSLLALVLVALPGRFLRPRFQAPALALVAALALVPFHTTFSVYWNRSEPGLAPQVAAVSRQTRGRMWFASAGLWKSLPPNLGALFSVRDIRYSDPFSPGRLALLGWARGPHDDLFQTWDAERALFLGVTQAWFLAPVKVRPALFPPLQGWPAPDPSGRALWVARAQGVPSASDALNAALKAREWERTVFLEGSAPPPAAPPPPASPRAAVVLLSDRASSSRWEVTTPGAGWLVLRDLYWPGWHATVDGRPAPIRAADGVFRAVSVPAGRHRISFSYAPWSFWLGCALSLLTLAVLAAAARVRPQ